MVTMPPLEILFEDGPCLVVNKPAGLLTQAPLGIDSLEVRVKAFLKDRNEKPGNVYLGVPHRLDRPVSGAIVLARHSRATRRLSDQFADRAVRKIYWACLEGSVAPEAGTWEDQLKKVPNEPRAEIVAPDDPDGRHAVLHYRTVGQTPHGSFLQIELETGRMHQIRIQAAARGHPVLGDAMYGATSPFGEQFEDTRLRAIALHGRRLGFHHPMTHELVAAEAPVPAAWSQLSLPG